MYVLVDGKGKAGQGRRLKVRDKKCCVGGVGETPHMHAFYWINVARARALKGTEHR